MHKAATQSVYVIGALRNPKVPEVASALRAAGYDVFDEWFCPGPEADEYWQKYEALRGRPYREALNGYHAEHVFNFDLYHLNRCNIGVLVLPAGKSAHQEIGYLRGQGKRTFVLFDKEPERYDLMYKFHTVVFDIDELIAAMARRDMKT